MIIGINDVITYVAKENIAGAIILQKIRLHKPTGVFFSINMNDKDELLYFAVGAMNSRGEADDRKSFEGNTQKSFFEAVAYFEELIEKCIPQEKPEAPAMGKFYYVKGQRSFVILNEPDAQPIYIEREDLDKVFSPPKKKPYGRLNMLELDDPKYDVIKSKFALKFLQEDTDEFLEKMGLSKGEAVVYKMMPYESDQSQGNEPGNEPPQVNDAPTSLDDIEDEDPKNLEGPQPSDKGDEDEDDDKGDKGEDGDKGEPGDDGDKGNQPQQGEPGDKGEPSDEGNPEQGEPGTEPGEPSDEGQPGNGDNWTPQDGTTHEQPQEIKGNLMKALAQQFGVQDVPYAFKRQQRMLNSLDSYSQKELQDTIYPKLGLDPNTPKSTFMNIVKEQTKQYFE